MHPTPQTSKETHSQETKVGPVRLLRWPFFIATPLIIIAILPWMFAMVDRPVVSFTHQLVGEEGTHRQLWGIVTTLGLGYLWIILFIVIGLGALISLIFARYYRTFLTGLVLNCLSSIAGLLLIMPIIYVLKVSIGRYRPGPYVNANQYIFDPFHRWDLGGSMPSGHSADIAATCIGLALWWSTSSTPMGRWGAWCWQLFWIITMFLVASSRVMLWVHFPSDTIAGLFLGTLAACLGRFLVMKTLGRLHKKKDPTVLSSDLL